jgi:Uma2 family endonuclease
MSFHPITIPPPPTEEDLFSPPDAPFSYGWRWVPEEQADGSLDWTQVPLTLDDVLHPHLEDYVSQSDTHMRLCMYLYTVLLWHLRHDPTAVVLHDVPMDWGVPRMKGHCPDLTVLRGVHTRFPRGVFQVKPSGGRVVLVIEVTSPTTRDLDVDNPERPHNKYRQYAQIGIPRYLVVDLARQKPGDPMPIQGYRLGARRRYLPLKPDQRGRVWVEPVGLALGPHGDGIAWYDREGKALVDYTGVQAQLEAEKQAREAEKQAREAAEARARELEARLHQMAGASSQQTNGTNGTNGTKSG